MRSDDLPAALFGGDKHVKEAGVGNAEQGFDALDFEELQDALINESGHGSDSLMVNRCWITGPVVKMKEAGTKMKKPK